MLIKSLISEVALRCGDPNFKEFDVNTYKRALYRANREIAKNYEIFKKILSFKLNEMVSNIDDDIRITIPDFKSEYMVRVNNYTLEKVTDEIQPQYRFAYYLEFKDGELFFNYVLGGTLLQNTIEVTGLDITTEMSQGFFEKEEAVRDLNLGKGLQDEIVIGYVSIPDLESELGEYDIPERFQEEQIEKSIFLIAKLGIVKYTDPESQVGNKYRNLLSLYKSEKTSDYDKAIAKDNAWIIIKPYSVI